MKNYQETINHLPRGLKASPVTFQPSRNFPDLKSANKELFIKKFSSPFESPVNKPFSFSKFLDVANKFHFVLLEVVAP